MNNVINDNRYFVKDESKKPFNVKMTEEEYNEEKKQHFDFKIDFNYNEKIQQQQIDSMKMRRKSILILLKECAEDFIKDFEKKHILTTEQNELNRQMKEMWPWVEVDKFSYEGNFFQRIQEFKDAINKLNTDIEVSQLLLDNAKKLNEKYINQVENITPMT